MKQRNSGRRRAAPRWKAKKGISEVPVNIEPGFHAACAAVDISPTVRQWKKWNKRTGRAWMFANQ